MKKAVKNVQRKEKKTATIEKVEVTQAIEDLPIDHIRELCQVEAISEFNRMGKRKDGGQWYKDKSTHTCYGVDFDKSGTATVKETKEMKKVQSKAKKVDITCMECGDIRNVASQDAFQVKRCVPCQKKFRNGKRAELAKTRRADKRKTNELESLNS